MASVSATLQLTVNVLSAKLDQVKGIFSKKINCYTVVSLTENGDTTSNNAVGVTEKKSTVVDTHSNNNPKWNSSFEFLLADDLDHDAKPFLIFELFSCRKYVPDKRIGQVTVPLPELLSTKQEISDESRDVTSSSGKHKGVIYFSYRFDFFETKKPDQELLRVKANNNDEPNVVDEPVKTITCVDEARLVLATAVLVESEDEIVVDNNKQDHHDDNNRQTTTLTTTTTTGDYETSSKQLIRNQSSRKRMFRKLRRLAMMIK